MKTSDANPGHKQHRKVIEALRTSEIADLRRRETVRQTFLTHLRGEIRSWFAPTIVKTTIQLSSHSIHSKDH